MRDTPYPLDRSAQAEAPSLSWLAFFGLCQIPLLAGAFALLAPPAVLSTELTWDLLFNLSGAWHLATGHIQHVDFHEAVGELNFRLTALGFSLVGPSPKAMLVGSVLLATAVSLCATLVAGRRLPRVAAFVFVAFVTLLMLMPANVGDPPTAFSFAMSYNRYGWSIFCVITLILFLRPTGTRHGEVVDASVVLVFAIALYHLKITYYVAALGALMAALVLSGHVRRSSMLWIAVTAIAAAYAILPHNWPYLSDLYEAAQSGQIRKGRLLMATKLLTHPIELAPYVAAIGLAAWMWLTRQASVAFPCAVAFLIVTGVCLLSQNAQVHGLPIGIAVVFLFYGRLAAPRDERQKLLLAALLILPLASIGSSALSLGTYWARASEPDLHVVRGTQLAGLAVPLQEDVLTAFRDASSTSGLLNRARTAPTRGNELTSTEYVATIEEAARLFAGQRTDGIVVLDQINPLSFTLGGRPPRGGNLWSDHMIAVRPAGEAFQDAEHVLVPKFPTFGRWTEKTMDNYGGYIREYFPFRSESAYWIRFSRKAPTHDTPLVGPGRKDPPVALPAALSNR